MVVLDAARADHFGVYGYFKSTTPNIDRIAQESVVFERAYSVADYTLPSIASLWTGLQMKTHGIIGNANVIPSKLTLLPEMLLQKGIATGLVSSNPNFLQASFQRGFQYRRVFEYRPHESTVSPFQLVHAGSDWLKQQKTPFFLFIHLLQPHAPYTPPAEFVSPSTVPRRYGTTAWLSSPEGFQNQGKVMKSEHLDAVQQLYDANLRWADAAVQDLYKSLKDGGYLENSWLVITSDHGEGLGEHLFYGHSCNVYEEMIRVPLIILPPSSKRNLVRGRRQAWVYLQDLHSTILEWFGIKPPKGTDFISLRPILDDPKLVGRKILVSCTYNFGRCALIEPPWKLIVSRQGPMHVELYRLPDERLLTGNLAPLEVQKVENLYRKFNSWNHSGNFQVAENSGIEEWLEQLRALGYLGMGTEDFFSYRVHPTWLPSKVWEGDSRFLGWVLEQESKVGLMMRLENRGNAIWPSLSINNEANTVVELTFSGGNESFQIEHNVPVDVPPGKSRDFQVPLPMQFSQSQYAWNVAVEIGQVGGKERYALSQWKNLKIQPQVKFDSGFSLAKHEATSFWMDKKGQLLIFRPRDSDQCLSLQAHIYSYYKPRRWIIKDPAGREIARGVARQDTSSKVAFPLHFRGGAQNMWLSVESLDGTTVPADVSDSSDIRALSIRIENVKLQTCRS